MSKPFNDWPNDVGFDTDIQQLEPIELTVHGKIPAYAAGTLFRTGPGCHKLKDTKKGDFSVSHWFDGFSHVYRFQIIPASDGNSKVIYNSRRQVDHLIENVRKTGKFEHISFGQKRDPCEGLFAKMKSAFATQPQMSDPEMLNVSVTIHPNAPGYDGMKVLNPERVLEGPIKTLVTFSDYNGVKRMDPETLQPIGVVDQTLLDPQLNGPNSAAHAQFDPITGDLFNFNLNFGRIATYKIFKTSASTGKTEILATVQDPDVKAGYMHSFFLTEDYVVFAVWAAFFGIGGIQMLWERNMLEAIRKFDPNSKTTWLVVDRKHGRGLVAKFKSPASFCFHSINAYQEQAQDGTTDIFCDAVCYSNLDVMHRFYYENLTGTGPGVQKYAGLKNQSVNPSFVRHQLSGIPSASSKNPASKVTADTNIVMSFPGPKIGELPTMNGAWKTKKHRYVYGVVDRGLSSLFDGIVKTDIDTETAEFWGVPHHTPGEPIFVADPEGAGEDDGVLLSVVLDGDKGTSYLVCLDARDMTELGRAEVGAPVGFGFHGSHAKL